MKIIGKSASGWIVEATSRELYAAVGQEAPYQDKTGLGAEFAVRAYYERCERFRAAIAAAREGAKNLAALADLSAGAVPTFVTIPPEKEEVF